MTEAEIRAVLKSVAPAIAWDDVGAKDDLEAAGLDSLDKASVIMELETLADITIDDDRYGDLTTIEDLQKETSN